MEINEDTLELLERRLGERVEKRARARLVAIYGLVGSVIMGTIGFFGYDLVDGARSKVDAAVEEIEDDAKRFAREAVADSVVIAEEATKRASRLVERVSIRLEMQDDWLRQRERVLKKNEERVIEAQVKVDEISADIERRLGGILETVDEIEGQFNAQSERSKDVAGIANVAEVDIELEYSSGDFAVLKAVRITGG